MKKIFLKKYDSLVVLLIVCIMAIIVPTITIVYADPECNPDGTIASKGENREGEDDQSHQITYVPDNGTHKYNQPFGVGEDRSGGASVTFTDPNTGKVSSQTLYETEEDLQRAKNMNLCALVTCTLASDLGLSGSRSTWDEQIAEIGNAEGKNGKTFDFSHPFSQAKARAILDGKTDENGNPYDVNKMTQAELEAAATRIAQTEGSFSKSSFSSQTIVKEVSTGEWFVCPGDSRCGDAIADGFAVDVKKQQNWGKAKTSDEGSLCKGEDCPPDDGHGDDDDDDGKPGDKYIENAGEVINFEINADSCELSIPEIPTIPPKTVPRSPGQTGGTCGSVAQNVTYSTSTAACGKVVLLTTTTTTAHLPEPSRSSIFAGAGFDWGGVSSVTNVSTRVFDDSALQNEYNTVQAQVVANTSAMTCVDKSIAKLDQDYASSMSQCSQQVAANQASCSQCTTDCNISISQCHNEGRNDCNTTCNCSVCDDVGKQQAICDGLTAEYNKQKTALLKQKEGYQKNIEAANLQLQELNNCASQIPSGLTSSTNGTVSISNQTMNLNNKYTQKIDTIKGIAKNSGSPLTQSEIDALDSETYIKISHNFFVPYYTPNLTSGNLTANISGGGINIPNYSCPITVYNTVKCDPGTGCDLKVIYRPISLTDPFPNNVSGTEYREMGSNWSEFYADNYIKNNRHVDDYQVYNMTPLYTITLTPSTIKDIRAYNKSNSLTDFKMRCSNGYQCISSFIWDDFSNIIDTGNSCASSNGWDESCYYGGVTQ